MQNGIEPRSHLSKPQLIQQDQQNPQNCPQRSNRGSEDQKHTQLRNWNRCPWRMCGIYWATRLNEKNDPLLELEIEILIGQVGFQIQWKLKQERQKREGEGKQIRDLETRIIGNWDCYPCTFRRVWLNLESRLGIVLSFLCRSSPPKLLLPLFFMFA